MVAQSHSTSQAPGPPTRQRLRALLPNLKLGNWPPGPLNGITDVTGVLTHTTTLQPSSNPSINTGVTVILPHRDWFGHAVYANMFRFNGSGEMTGSHWLHETGLLHSPIVLTNSFSVGEAYRGVYDYAIKHHSDRDGSVGWFLLPVVAETFDGYLNDMTTFAVTPNHVVQGIQDASANLTAEGCAGGGTGMLCQGFKGGTGTSSRVVPGLGLPKADGTVPEQDYTVGVLVQANYGRLRDFRVAGVPVGSIIMQQREKEGESDALKQQAEYDAAKDKKDGSIVVILATDAPLHPTQLERLAKRATVGLARVGGYGHNPSGDLFLAFSTANKIPVQTVTAGGKRIDPFQARALGISVLDDQSINAVFEAAADATEEAIYNAICMAQTTTGHKGMKVDAIDLQQLKSIMERYT
ncbi:peptidase family S58-domain-containing protein [Coniella lustricola]|uniref:Peptidase family S58-domain-containing protein n=1 Tax=Coniella lustricola TaxID=2025994 RepID=A0A2T3AM90_9PEZI|nr:peptidase family S58-domain-containing protein [Coniella lustricola]